MLDHHYWRELSRLVDAFRQVGKMGGKATWTSSTENGLWRASLDIQTNPSPAAQPGLASTPTPHSAAPNQDGAAGRRRPDNAGTQPPPFGHKNEPGLTRPLWLPEDKARLQCPHPVRLWPPESRQSLHHHHHHHHHHQWWWLLARHTRSVDKKDSMVVVVVVVSLLR